MAAESLIDERGFDTWLARLLHARGRVELERLQRLLVDARSRPGRTLAQSLLEGHLLSRDELDACLQELMAARTLGPPVGSAGAPEPAWQPGGLIDDRYRIEEQLGAGGMGVVYRGVDVSTGAPYALKTLSSPDAEMQLRFQREGEAQARVDSHPNVVRVHTLGRAAGRPYLVMDLATGGDLARRLKAGPLREQEAATLIRDLARGLAAVHRAGVLHRDLKPENVLFDERGTPKLVDFGLARLEGAGSLTESGALLGSPRYMAPEQAEGRQDRIGETTDVYGLGAVLYHCLTGRPPFDGQRPMLVLLQVINEAPSPLREHCPGLSRALESICLRCLEKHPGDRYPSAEALTDDLERYLAGVSPIAADGKRRATLMAGLAGAALLAVLVAIAAAINPRGHAASAKDPLSSSPLPTSPLEKPGVDPADAQPGGTESPAAVSDALGGVESFNEGILLRRSDPVRVEAAFSRVLLDPGDLDPPFAAYLERGAARSRMGKHADAVLDYSRGLSLAGQRFVEHNRWLRQRAEAYAAMGENYAALDDLAELLERDPMDSKAVELSVELWLEQGEVADARRVFDLYPASVPRKGRLAARLDQAETKHLRGDERYREVRRSRGSVPLSASLEGVREALAIDDRQAGAWELRADLLEEGQDYREALEAMEVSIRLDPFGAERYVHRGSLLKVLAQHGETSEHYPNPAASAGLDAALSVQLQRTQEGRDIARGLLLQDSSEDIVREFLRQVETVHSKRLAAAYEELAGRFIQWSTQVVQLRLARARLRVLRGPARTYKAIEDLRFILANDPPPALRTLACLDLAEAHLTGGSHEGALDALRGVGLRMEIDERERLTIYRATAELLRAKAQEGR